MNLFNLLHPITSKCLQDGILSSSDADILRELTFDLDSLDSLMLLIGDKKIIELFDKLFQKMTSSVVNTTRINIEKKFGPHIWNILFSSLENIEFRNQFSFKINVEIDDTTDVEIMLSSFDYIFCVRESYNQIQSGLCLGSKHFVVNDNDVTLMAFSYNISKFNPKWVRKGSKANIKFINKNRFILDLKHTAHELMANYLATH